MKDLIYLPEVVTLQLDEELCNGCGMCLKVCPHEVFELSGRKAHIIRKGYCMECGACQLNWPVNAVTVKAGVGCAAGLIEGWLKKTDPVCSCSEENTKCC